MRSWPDKENMSDHLVKRLTLKSEAKLMKELGGKRAENLLLLKAKGALQTHLVGHSYTCITLHSVAGKKPKTNVATGFTKGNHGPSLVPQVKGSLNRDLGAHS